jgi:membrane dipeptidase
VKFQLLVRREMKPIPRLLLRSVATAVVVAVCAMATVVGTQEAPDTKTLDRARKLLKEVPLIDGHNDLPWAMRQASRYDFSKVNIAESQPKLHTDIPKIKAGMLGGQFWSVYVPASLEGQRAVTATLEQIDAVYAMVRRYPETFEMARTADDVERVFKKGKVASMLGMEGGHSIDASLGTLRMFSKLGVGYMTLTHSANLPWADAAGEEPKAGGLTRFGEEVVREMNRLGMLVDLSHVSPDTMADAIRVTAAPVIFSHSSARAVSDVPRNVPDDILRLMPKNGGVVMITFVPGFISPDAASVSRTLSSEMRVLREKFVNDPAGLAAAREKLYKEFPSPKATLAQVADHIDHVRKVAGIDHLGVGGDYDGVNSLPVGLEDVSKYPALIAELIRRGYSDEDVRKILGKNVLRVMRAAEKVAARLQAERGPSLATIEELDGKPATH